MTDYAMQKLTYGTRYNKIKFLDHLTHIIHYRYNDNFHNSIHQ